MAQSKINELEFLGREGNQLSSTPVSGKRKPRLLLPLKKKKENFSSFYSTLVHSSSLPIWGSSKTPASTPALALCLRTGWKGTRGRAGMAPSRQAVRQPPSPPSVSHPQTPKPPHLQEVTAGQPILRAPSSRAALPLGVPSGPLGAPPSPSPKSAAPFPSRARC